VALHKPGGVRMMRLIGISVLAVAAVACQAQSTREFHRSLAVSAAEPVVLTVDIPNGELEVVYSRDGQLSITGYAKTSGDVKLDDNFFPNVLTVEQNGNHLSVRQVSIAAYDEAKIAVVYRIDVPYRTELTSTVGHGKQSISGILGPVKAVAEKGDIKASYISQAVEAKVENGNLNFQAIGEHVDARAGTGNISAERLAQGISAETGDGDITLMVVGPSTATVKKGNGRIDMGGARGNFTASTDGGDLHVKAIPHYDWKLRSASGTIRLDLPQTANFELDASTDSGNLQCDRDDFAKLDPDLHHLHQKVNSGGIRVDAHTASGKILIR
jgi:Putative adhesin